MADNLKFATIAVTGDFFADGETGATVPPLYLTNAYQFKNADYAADLFDLKEYGHIYTRLSNPTTDILEKRIAALEGGVSAVAASSGMASELLVLSTLCRQGDEIVASSKLYGGTLNLLNVSLKKFGINTVFVDQSDISAWENAITDKTKAFYVETLTNPDSSVPDFDAIAAIAEKNGIPFIVDNTMATPYLFRPVEHGANIVVHSTTKYLSGSGSVMGGIAVDLGNFDWEKSGRFPDFTEPDESYHGVSFTKSFGKSALAVRMRTTILRDFGGVISPFNSYITMLGLQTLHLRMQAHVENAVKIAEFLKNHKNVKDVKYAGFQDHPDYLLARKYLKKGAGSLLTFKVAGGYEKAKSFIESLKLCVHATNVGDSRTVITHPASTTHRQATSEQLIKAGISKDMIRVSVGIEDADDIIDDLRQALDNA